MARPSTPPRFSAAMRAVAGLLGAGSFGTGVYAVFVTDNGTGTGVLLAFGGVLLVLGLFGNRIDSFELGGAKLRLRAAAAERYALADESERQGDPATAARLRAEAQALLDAAGPIAADYRAVRATMRSGPERTRAMGQVVERARRLAREREFDPAEVRRWLSHGTDEERVTALGMMQARAELCDLDAVLDVIARPRTPFEHFNALQLAGMMIDDLDADGLRRLTDVVTDQLRGPHHLDSDRRELAGAILEAVAARPTDRA